MLSDWRPSSAGGSTRRSSRLRPIRGIFVLLTASLITQRVRSEIPTESFLVAAFAHERNVTIELTYPYLEHIKAVIFGLYTCDAKTSVCRYDKIIRRDPKTHDTFYGPTIIPMGVSPEQFDVGVFPWFLVGLKKHQAKPTSFGLLDLSVCDVKCYDEAGPSPDTLSKLPEHTVSVESNPPKVTFHLRFQENVIKCRPNPNITEVYLFALLKFMYVTNQKHRGYLLSKGATDFKFDFITKVGSVLHMKLFWNLRCPLEKRQLYYSILKSAN